MDKAEEAFKGLVKPRRRIGRCAKCNKPTEREERVAIQILAYKAGGAKQSLSSETRTYCALCARKDFDNLVKLLP